MSTASSLSGSGDLPIPVKGLVLPPELRNELRYPMGETVERDELEEYLVICHRVIAVGDMVSITLLEMGREPDVMVFDGRSERVDRHDLLASLDREDAIRVSNPPGMITPDLVSAIRKALCSDIPVRIRVDGEEDLAALVVMALAPEGSCVIYGLPGKGMILVKVDMRVMDKARSLIDRMEELR